MPSCPVPLDPGPGVRNQLRRERALRSGRRSDARIGERVKTRERRRCEGNKYVYSFLCVACPGTPKPCILFGEVAEL